MNARRSEALKNAKHTAKVLAALANPQRLLILCHLLQHGEAGAGALAEHFGFGHSALSQHLARMRAESLILQRRDGRALYYRLNDAFSAQLPPLLASICRPGPRMLQADLELTSRAVALASSSVLGSVDDGRWTAPLIHGAGLVHPLSDTSHLPDPRVTHRVVFALSQGNEHPDRVHAGLARIARLVNLYAAAGVPQRRQKVVAVVSGSAITLTFDAAHYREWHGEANPNLPVLRELRAAGVEIAVCGQTLMAQHGTPKWLEPGVTVALSALTTITELQREGYALLPF